MGARISVLRLIMSFSPYIRSAMVRFPLQGDCPRTYTNVIVPEYNESAAIYYSLTIKFSLQSFDM